MEALQQIPLLTITTPRRTHAILAGFCLVGCGIGIMRFVYGDSEFELSNDGFIFGALAIGFVAFAILTIKPRKKLEFSRQGLWTRRAGLQPWDMVDELIIETREGYKGAKERCLVLHWNEEVDLPGPELLEIFKFSDLDISEKRFREQMQPVLDAFRQ